MNGDILEHYGVKGMRWGVRKDRKTSVKTRTEGFILKKGSSLNRVSSITNERNEGKAYATFKKWDSVGYMARSMPFMRTFNMNMVVTRDLVAPSKKERIDAFIDLMKKDDSFATSLAEAKSRQEIFGNKKAFEDRYKKMSEAQLRAKAYNDLAVNMGFDKKVRDLYFKELKKRGFDMVIDDADAQAISHSPIIIFNRENSLKIASVDKVTIKYLLDFMRRDETMTDKVIKHYGTKGMRWGVRKKRKTSSDYKKTASLRKKRASELSNEELSTVTRRLGLESSYNRAKANSGKKFLQDILKNSGTSVLTTATITAMTLAGKAVIDKVVKLYASM